LIAACAASFYEVDRLGDYVLAIRRFAREVASQVGSKTCLLVTSWFAHENILGMGVANWVVHSILMIASLVPVPANDIKDM
jgi:hypothetical protein